MPRYDYKCVNCGRVWEAERPIVQRHEPIVCPTCGCAGKMAYTTAPVWPWTAWKTTSPFKK